MIQLSYKIFILSVSSLILLITGCQNPVTSQKLIDNKISFYQPGKVRNHYEKLVLVGGCFDVFHYGHLIFLKKAKNLGNYLVVALESDENILKYKKRHPIHVIRKRAEILASLIFVDEVVMLPPLQEDKHYSQLVKDIYPAYIAVTSDDPQFFNKQKQANSVGGQVKVVTSLLPNLSTTCIRQETCRKS